MLYHIWQQFFFINLELLLFFVPIFLSVIFQRLEQLTSHCEDAVNLLQNTISKLESTVLPPTAEVLQQSIQYFSKSSSAEQSHRKRFVLALSRMRVLYMYIFWQTLLYKASCIKGIHFCQFLHYLGTEPNVFLCSVVWGIYIVGTLSVIHCDLPQEGITMALKSSILSLRDFYSISMK